MSISKAAPVTELERATLRAVSVRIIPFLCIAYFVAYLDRVNVGFAALTMNEDLKFSPLVFSTGAGIFFIAYFLFEVPSNLALARFGARRWIARIMVTWGLISSAMMFMGGSASFYTFRFLLGLAEAGFFPGIILYLTFWYPAAYRARILAAFIFAIPIATVIGAPLSSLVMSLNGSLGLKGWQWLFLLEGIPSVLLGIVTWFYMTDSPAKAAWLSAEQKAWLLGRLQSEAAAKRHASQVSVLMALRSPKVLALCGVYFGFVAALYGTQFWIPQIVKALGFSDQQTGFVTAVPYLFGAVTMIFWGRHSDKTRERTWHVALPLILTAIALGWSSQIHGAWLSVGVLSLATIGVFCTFAIFWTLPSARLGGTAAAAGIAMINSIGNLAGFGGPYLIGWFKETTGSVSTGLLVLAAFPLMAGLLVLVIGNTNKLEFGDAHRKARV